MPRSERVAVIPVQPESLQLATKRELRRALNTIRQAVKLKYPQCRSVRITVTRGDDGRWSEMKIVAEDEL